MKLVHLLLTAGALTGGAGAFERHPWLRFDEGAWVERTIHRSDESRPMTRREVLVSADDLSYTVQSETAFDDLAEMDPIRDEHRSGFGHLGFAHLDPDAENLGTETVTLDGRKYACTIWRAQGRYDDHGAVDTAWVSGELAHPVRIHHVDGRSQFLLELVGLRETVRIGRKQVTCVQYAGVVLAERDGEQVEQRIEWWHSLDVPGGLVRAVLTIPDENGEPAAEHVTEVVAFGTRPTSR